MQDPLYFAETMTDTDTPNDSPRPISSPGAKTKAATLSHLDLGAAHRVLTDQASEAGHAVPLSPSDLKDAVGTLVARIFAHKVLGKESETRAAELTSQLRGLLPMGAMPTDVTSLKAGPIALRLQWQHNEESVLNALRSLMAQSGVSDEEIAATLNNDNLFEPPQYSIEGLLRSLERKGIDPATDPAFADAAIGPRARRLDTLVGLFQDLNNRLPEDRKINPAELLDVNTSQVAVEMVRMPAAGPLRQLREEAAKSLRAVSDPAVDGLATHFRETWESQEAAEPAPAPARKRSARP